MRLFADPTELTSQSRLPKDVAEACEPLPHLEDLTGADLLLSIKPIPATTEALLRVHAQSGLLVQFKRWNDLQAAITTEQRLFYEIMKMREWTPRPWLLVTGALFAVNGQAVVGQVTGKSLKNGTALATLSGRPGLSFASVDGALDAWAYYGGYVKQLSEPVSVLGWLQRQASILEKIESGEVTELTPRSVQRELVDATPVSWLAALFDGIGRKTAQAILERLRVLLRREPRLYEAISYVTNYQSAEIPGITRERVGQWRAHLGLQLYPSSDCDPEIYDTLATEPRLMETGETYWRWMPGRHYRYAGPVDPLKTFGPTMFQTLFGQLLAVTYVNDLLNDETVVGIAERTIIDRQFEWLVLSGGLEDGEQVLRLDKVTNVEVLEG